MSFEKNVFINCPFDKDYLLLLRPLIFSILYFDLAPQISKTESSGKSRVGEIMKLIRKSKYSIHDISRNKPLKPGDIPRFNMPYEIGLDIGSSIFGTGVLKTKKCLVLDTERYYFQKVMSDIGGQDIKDHNDSPERIIAKVREWFVDVLHVRLASPAVLWEKYNEFIADIYQQLSLEGYTNIDEQLSVSEFIILAKAWIKKRKSV